MGFSVQDFHDLVRLLEAHPEWRAELRRLLLSEELLELPYLFRELVVKVEALVEAQTRTEERVGRLEEVVAKLDERVGRLEEAVAKLAEAQARTEERVGRLEEAVARLAEAQARTDSAVADLARAVKDLRTRVGRLENALGLDVEKVAAFILNRVLRERGLEPVGQPRAAKGNGLELDLVWPAEGPGGRVWVLVEAKHRLDGRAVLRFGERLRSEGFKKALQRRRIKGPYLPYAFGIVIYYGTEEAAERTGVGVLSTDGEWVPPKEYYGS